MKRFLLLLLLMLLPAAAFAQDATTPLPVTHVTLYTSGVGYFERTGTVTDSSSSTMYFPLEQVNDVLKSLVLLDYDGGKVEPVTYGAIDPISRQLKAFSIDLSDNPDQATLLNRLRGADVTISYKGPSPEPPVTGTIVGVETKTVQLPGQASAASSAVNIMTADSLVSVPLDYVGSIEISDPALRAEIKQALSTVAQGRDNGKRPVTVNFAGAGKRHVLVGYLTQTPLWQTSYRLVLGKKPFLQGWALVQNTSQEDWSNISLSLVSGRPISFIEDLYTPVYTDRPVVQPQIVGSPAPQIYAGNLDIDKVKDFEQNKVDIGGEVNAPPRSNGVSSIIADSQDNSLVAEPSMGALTKNGNFLDGALGASVNSRLIASGAKLGSSLFSYVIKVPVNVPRQKSAMIPFVGSTISAERVSIYNAATEADHPLAGARLKNTSGLHLMGGPITVFDDDSNGNNGYVGDAQIDDTEADESRLISFAVDLAVDSSSQSYGQEQRVQLVTASKGILNIEDVVENKTTYTFKNNSDEDRIVVVEHPYSYGNKTLVEPTTYTQMTPELYRFDVPVAAHAKKEFVVRTRDVVGSSYQLTNVADSDLKIYIAGSGISDGMKAALARLISLRTEVANTQSKISANEAASAQISTDQDRIRKNMVVLDKSTSLYKRYAAELDAQETKINDLSAQHDSLESDLATQHDVLSNYIAGLTVI